MTEAFSESVAVQAIAWMLLQSLWQGAVVSAATAIVLATLWRSSASRRYVVACIGLLAFLAVAIATAAGRASDLRGGVDEGPRARSTVDVTLAAPAFVEHTGLIAHAGGTGGLTQTGPGRRLFRDRLQAWSVAAVPLWLIGVLALSVQLAASWYVVGRIRRGTARPVPEDWRPRLDALVRRVRISRPIRLVESALVQVPIVIGWLRPVILLPGSIFTALSPMQLEAVIAHELAHIRRHDYLVNVLQTTAEILLFYHPATWWISRRIRVEREHCCDDFAVEICGDRLAYAQALADLEEVRHTVVPLAVAATDGPLVRRIRRLLRLSSASNDRSSIWIAAGTILAVLFFALISEEMQGVEQAERLRGSTSQLDAAAARLTGVAGRVVDAQTGQPVANVTVALSSDGQLADVVTHTDGRFEARGLAPGEYRMFVRAAGYVEVEYGKPATPTGVGPGYEEAGTRIDVRKGLIVSGLDVSLQRAGVISGRVLGDTGDGLARAEVEVMTRAYLPGGVGFVPAAFAQTDSSGSYRLVDLRPGQYRVRAYVPRTIQPSKAESGHSYARTFFPQMLSGENALPIHVDGGQEVFDIDIMLETVRLRSVSGTVVDASGQPARQVSVRLMGPIGPSGPFIAELTSDVSSAGTFRIENVAPGDYMVNVVDRVHPVRWLSANRQITVDEDVPGLHLAAGPDVRIEGTVLREGGRPVPFDVGTVRLGIAQWGEGCQRTVGLRLGNVRRDGTFSFDGPSGTFSMQATSLPRGWRVKEIRVDGRDRTHEATDFAGGVRYVEVVVTDQLSQVVGVVTDRYHRGVPGATVVVFPEDRSRWSLCTDWDSEAPSGFVRGVRPGRDAAFLVAGLPAADYRAVAVESLPFLAWTDPKVLERLWPSAVRFRLGEGGQRTVNLRVAQGLEGLAGER